MKKLVNKIKDNLNIFQSSKGFTLLELLVVVLIIGILAGIALPQYQMAVGKAKFSELKNITKSIAGAMQRYYLTNDKYPQAAKDLDVNFNITSGNESKWFYINNEISCGFWSGENETPYVTCGKEIFKTKINLYINRDTARPEICLANSLDKNDKANRLCKKETGKSNNDAIITNNKDGYKYHY